MVFVQTHRKIERIPFAVEVHSAYGKKLVTIRSSFQVFLKRSVFRRFSEVCHILC